MGAAENLAIVIPHGAASPAQISRAIDAAKALVPVGPVGRIDVIDLASDEGPAFARNTGIDRAMARNAAWIFFLEPEEVPHKHALSYLSAISEAYDGLWGSLEIKDRSGATQLLPKSQMGSSDTVRNYHMALHWWIGKSHIIRTAVADRLRFNSDTGDAWYGDYLVRLWETAKCLKSAQPLTCGEIGRLGLSGSDQGILLDRLRTSPKYISFQYKSETISLAYTGRNPTLERVQMRGLFYEQPDLECVADYVKPGAVCVDVGANTGNHTVYFEKILGASKVIPIEPNPDTIVILNQVIERNHLTKVDASHLGLGVGREVGQFDIKTGRRGFLGTAQLDPNQNGKIKVVPLDEIIRGNVDLLKIDVERMEIDVLEGARSLILRCLPVLLIEAQDENILSLLAILNNLGYRVENIIPDQGYANYVALPRKESLGQQ